MNKQTQLLVRTKKNWKFAYGMFFVGLWLISLSGLLFFVSENTGSTQLVLMLLFFMGFILALTLPYTISIKEKDLIFTFSVRRLKMVNPQDKKDPDFNRIVFLTQIRKFYHRKGIRWIFIGPRRISEFVNGLFYLDSHGEEKLFLDLTLPELTLDELQIKEIVQFVENGLASKD